MDSDTALGRMQVAAALWSVGQVSAAEMVDLACELLVTGFDGFNLAMLAGVHARHADEDVPELLEAALADVGLSYYARDSHTGQEAAVRVVAARVLAGLVPPRDLARWAHLTIGHGGVALAERLVELDDVYDVVHYVDTTEHDVDSPGDPGGGSAASRARRPGSRTSPRSARTSAASAGHRPRPTATPHPPDTTRTEPDHQGKHRADRTARSARVATQLHMASDRLPLYVTSDRRQIRTAGTLAAARCFALRYEYGMAQIVWWEIETPTPEAFQGFHRELWGWTFEPAFADTELGAEYWIIKSDGRSLGGLQRSQSHESPRAGTRLYVEVEDLEAVLQRVLALGGKVERPRTGLGGNDRWFATALDPSGVSFGLWTANPSQAQHGLGLYQQPQPVQHLAGSR